MIKPFHLLFVILVFSSWACTKAQSQSKKNGKHHKEDKYQEDLTAYRPKYNSDDTVQVTPPKKDGEKIAPTNDVTKALNAKMDTLSAKNVGNKFTQGYRILVYSGQSGEEVKKARGKVYELIPDADIYTDFHSPNQRVKVGNCLDRLEANLLFGKLKKQFRNAIIIPDNVVIKAK